MLFLVSRCAGTETQEKTRHEQPQDGFESQLNFSVVLFSVFYFIFLLERLLFHWYKRAIEFHWFVSWKIIFFLWWCTWKTEYHLTHCFMVLFVICLWANFTSDFWADTMSNSTNCSRWFDVLENRISIFPLSILFLWKSFCSFDGEFHFFHFVGGKFPFSLTKS